MTGKSWSNPAMMKILLTSFFGELVVSINKLDCVLCFHDMTCMIVSALFFCFSLKYCLVLFLVFR